MATSPPRLLRLWNAITGAEEFAESSYRSMKSIGVDHYYIHAGLAYQTSHVFSLGNSEIHWMTIVPQAGVQCHLRDIRVQGSGAPFEVRLYETNSIDVASLGTKITPVNYNRVSSNVSSLGVYSDPVIVSTGSQIDVDIVPVTAKDSGASNEGTIHEWVLANSSNYYNVGVTNTSGGNASYIMKLKWYHPN